MNHYIILQGEIKTLVLGPYDEATGREVLDSDEGLVYSLLVDDDPEVGCILDVYLTVSPPSGVDVEVITDNGVDLVPHDPYPGAGGLHETLVPRGNSAIATVPNGGF